VRGGNERIARLSPDRQNRLHPIGDLLPGEKAIHASREHRIIRSVLMTDRRGYCGRERALIQTPPRQSSSYSSAVPGGRVRRDCRRLTGRTAGKEFSNFQRHPGDQFAVLFLLPRSARSPRFRAFSSVFRTLLFGFFQCGLLHQNALPFITPARPAEAHDNGRALAITGSAPRHGSIAGRKILKIVKPRAWQAQRLFRLHNKEAASRKLGAAFRTRGVPQNFEDYRLRRAAQFLREPPLFALRQGGGDIVSAIVLLNSGIAALAESQIHSPVARPAT
jgi:hypothetical protein